MAQDEAAKNEKGRSPQESSLWASREMVDMKALENMRCKNDNVRSSHLQTLVDTRTWSK